jgi:hypothetical protein
LANFFLETPEVNSEPITEAANFRWTENISDCQFLSFCLNALSVADLEVFSICMKESWYYM